MKRILFVDDDPNILQGLKRMLRSMRWEWDTAYVGRGEDALSMMRDATFDVVVSDLRMPGMDGATLLGEIKDRYPNTVRILLSGQSEMESMIKTIGKTHQYLSKPCSPDLLKNTVARACALKELLTDERLRMIASQLENMPSIPEMYLALVDELNKEYPSVKDVSEIIAKDMAMTAKILQLVNSAFFGMRRRVTTVEMAVNYLGLEILSSLVLAANIFSRFDNSKSINGFSMASLWNHSGQVGRSAQTITKHEDTPKENTNDAMTAGLLHDCGKLIFASNIPEKYAEALSLMASEKISVREAEEEIIGASHDRIGAYLLGVWGLPDSIVEAVAFHHTPESCPTTQCLPLTAVHVADVVAHGNTGEGHLDMNYLTACGWAEHVEAWTNLISSQ